MKAYAVIAYRWGWLNNSHYLVDITTDLEAAQNAATAEAYNRGGKYGVTVWDSEKNSVFHAPSLYGEKQAHMNWRIEMFERIGNNVVGLLEADETVTHEKVLSIYQSAKHTEEMMSRLDGTTKVETHDEEPDTPKGDVCTSCGEPIDHSEPHMQCESCREK